MMDDCELVARALEARRNSYSPYSHFAVGAALEAEDGTVSPGCNIECASFGGTICAERTALVKAVSEGNRRFTRIAIVGNGEQLCQPCGICRQLLREFAPDITVLAANEKGEFRSFSLNELLPHSFGPESL